jgi:hypothetical protein
LRDGVVAAGGFGEIEAAQLVVQNAGVARCQRGLARGELFREGEGGLLLFLVERDGGFLLLAAGGHGHALEGDLGGVQSDRGRRLGEVTSIDSTPEKVAALRSGVRVSV